MQCVLQMCVTNMVNHHYLIYSMSLGIYTVNPYFFQTPEISSSLDILFNKHGGSKHTVPHLFTANQSFPSEELFSYESPILTLYTTFKTNMYKNLSNSNVIRNWAQLLPCVQPVLFTQLGMDADLIVMARQLSWITQDVERGNENGLPIFKDLFFQAKLLVMSFFYGFSNGDILFDSSLIMTLKTVARAKHENQKLQRCMIIGRRKNINLGNMEIYNLADVETKLKKLEFFQSNAEDYFLISDNDFPWMKIPDLVIGRPGESSLLV